MSFLLKMLNIFIVVFISLQGCNNYLFENEYYKIFKKGYTEWNKWRRKHPTLQPDLSYVDFRGHDIVNIDLYNLDGTRFVEANLSNIKIINSKSKSRVISFGLYNLNFSKASFIKTRIYTYFKNKVYIGNCIFKNANFNGAYFKNIEINYNNFQHANFNQAHIRDNTVAGCTFANSTFIKANLQYIIGTTNTIFNDTNFSEAIIQNCDFGYIDLYYLLGQINDAKYIKKFMPYADFKKTNFTSAKLINTGFHKINFTKGLFCNSIIKNVNFYYCNLQEVNFNKSIIIDTNFNNELIRSNNIWSPVLANSVIKKEIIYKQVNLKNQHLLLSSQLVQATFQNAILTNVNFTNANLTNVNFYKSKFQNVIFKNADMTGAKLERKWYDYVKKQGVRNFNKIRWM